jgi:putative membrane protein
MLIGDIPASVLIGLTVAAALYVGAARLGRRRIGPQQWFWFAVAMATALVALGPVDVWAERRVFFMQMLEHLVLALVIPPMVLLAVPDWMLRPWVLSRPVEPLARLLTRPVVAFLVFTAVFVTAHDPSIFELMCRDPNFHAAVHVSFILGGILLWWPILSPLPELPPLSYPHQILYLFLVTIPMTAVAAPITLARSVVYPWYLEGPHPWGLTPMSDQVLGGLLMWIGQGIYLMCVFTVVFYHWARNEEEEPQPAAPDRPKLNVVAVKSAGRQQLRT